MNTKRSKRSRRRGVTVIEMVMTAVISLMVLIAGTTCYLTGLMSWYRGETRIQTEVGSQQAVREIAMALRQAMSVTVDAGGMGLSYRLPQTDVTGTYLNPVVWDGVTRRIELDGANLVIKASNASDRIICTNVITKDPFSTNGNVPYTVFTAGPGTITRSLTAMVVSKTTAPNTPGGVFGRHRETIYLRNIPQLTQ